MITTLILGAGASFPYGFPLGSELLLKVKAKFGAEQGHREQQIYRGLQHLGIESLDAFMNHDSETGPELKCAIRDIILSSESENAIDSATKTGWYAGFFSNVLTQNLRNFRIVSFNYDRSFEFYMSRGLAAREKCSPTEAFALLRQLPIVHVHGRLPNLPGETGYECIGLRAPLKYGDYRPLIDRAIDHEGPHSYTLEREILGPLDNYVRGTLKHCYENRNVCERAKQAVEESDRVLFLGFGFHETNMSALGYPFKDRDRTKRVGGTAHGLTGVTLRRVGLDHPEIKLFPGVTAAEFLLHHVDLERPELDSWR